MQVLRKDVKGWSEQTNALRTTYSAIRVLTRMHLQMQTINKEEEEMTEMFLCHHLEMHPLKTTVATAGSEQHPMRQMTVVEEMNKQTNECCHRRRHQE